MSTDTSWAGQNNVSKGGNLDFLTHIFCSNPCKFINRINTVLMPDEFNFFFIYFFLIIIVFNVKRYSKINSFTKWRVYHLDSFEWTVERNVDVKSLFIQKEIRFHKELPSVWISKQRESKSQEDWISFFFFLYPVLVAWLWICHCLCFQSWLFGP